VSAVLLPDKVTVSWTGTGGATSYAVYRIEGNSAGSLLTETSGLSFDDTTYPHDKPLQYKVQSAVGNMVSQYSENSNRIIIDIQNVQVSKLEQTGIQLRWSPIEDEALTGYVVYRYAARGLVNDDFHETVQVNSYMDTTCAADTPCFYRVTWLAGGHEYGSNATTLFGVKSSAADNYEANNTQADIETDNTSLLYDWQTGDWSRAPVIYSFTDGAGYVEMDTDWYKYKGAPATITVSTALPPDTPFKSDACRLYINFYYRLFSLLCG